MAQGSHGPKVDVSKSPTLQKFKGTRVAIEAFVRDDSMVPRVIRRGRCGSKIVLG